MINFKINNIDISNDVDLNTVTYMKRLDDVFGTGSFQFESKTIDYNISPYSILTANNEQYCCSSEANYHYGKKSWFHNVSIIELTSLLSRFLVGSKAFSVTGSNRKDYEKINILIELINNKYGVNIKFKDGFDVTKFNKEIEYVFTAGTTLFDALSEILKNYNYRIMVDNVTDDIIYLNALDLATISFLSLDDTLILSKRKIQNSENYCKYLEMEATNVIDTNQLTIASNLFPKASDIKLNEDTFRIETPTNIFKLKKFEVISLYQNAMKVQIQFDENIWLSQAGTTTEKSFLMWEQQYPFLERFWANVFSKYFLDKDWFYSQIWVGQEHILYPKNTSETLQGDLLNARLTLDLTSHILSKEQYDLIEDKDKPDYAYYTNGSNVIDGFNIYYKNDFWNDILGEDNYPFLIGGIKGEDTSGLGFSISKDAYISVFKVYSIASTSPLKSVYRVTYYPIANPYMIDEKVDTPLNETTYKPYAISFNKSSNYVDFDKLQNSMQIENKSIGKVEMVLEYDTTNLTFLYPLMAKLRIEDKDWYVVSSQTNYNGTQQVTTFNLVSNYNKIADVISLNSQYNTLKNPLDNVIERPLLVKTNANFEAENGKLWFALRFYDKDGDIIGDDEYTYNLVQATIYSNANDLYLYCQMQDNYSISRNAQTISTNVYKLNDVPYVNANNEFYKVKIDLFELNGFDYESAIKLPVHKFASNEYYTKLIDTIETIVYKDAREKITFTIKANNCIIK
jgi:hypothetical protein